MQKLKQEVKKLNSLESQNLATVFDLHQEEINLSIVPDICRGEELFDRMVIQTCITETQVAKHLLQMGSALMYLGPKDIVHNDIKPENFLFEALDENSFCKLLTLSSASTSLSK